MHDDINDIKLLRRSGCPGVIFEVIGCLIVIKWKNILLILYDTGGPYALS